ncbi:PAC2 family protein [uncultured Georgenia sp.]|uniref:proteasome assembly chaperone family protein n=1 Tax=uncultured Georgenia sp. TaxID=378209 RepID=UPI0026306AB6|nr:PAC2 family protein [uncultured Georgenia sp.]HLV02956.1 PAC2 family protein [Actinomycetaceae bacterium]
MELYDVHPEAGDVHARVLVNALTGAMDAGHAAALAARHLTESLDTQRVWTFNIDELIDYRAHRPPMTFENWRWTDYDEPYVVLDLLRDDEGTPLLLLHGSEPDLRWGAFVDAVIDAVEQFGVERTISIHGVPMGVPHTRPTTVTAHATEPGLIPSQPEIIGTIQVPGSVTGLIEYRLGQAGHQAVGFSANVPHYLAQSPFHQAAAELIRQTARSGDLALPVGDLEQAASTAALEIARQVSASPEVTAVVRALEQQFDAFMRGANQETKATLTAQPVELPTAEEIGAAVEAFLADQVDQESLGGRTTELGTGPETAAERPADEAENASDEDGAPKQ